MIDAHGYLPIDSHTHAAVITETHSFLDATITTVPSQLTSHAQTRNKKVYGAHAIFHSGRKLLVEINQLSSAYFGAPESATEWN